MAVACSLIEDYTGTSGAMAMLYSIRDCIPIAFPALMFIIFLMIFAGNYYFVKNKTGRAKILIALLSSSIVSTVLSVFLLLSNLLDYRNVILYAFLAIISYISIIVSDKM